MKKYFQFLRIFSFLLITFLGGLWLNAAAPVQAQATPTMTVTPTAVSPAGPPQPTAVQPASVSNTIDTELLVTGANFVDGAAVVLEGYGALATTFVSANLLRAAVPAGVSPRVYTVTVVNPDARVASLPNALTVIAPLLTPDPTNTPEFTATPAPTAFIRPLLVVESYGASSALINPGENLDFEMTLANAGQRQATNVIATFVSGSFVPRGTGGVRALGALQPGEKNRFWQPLAASKDLAGQSIATLEVKVSYTDVNGTAYSETFALTFPVKPAASGVQPTATATPTATPTATALPRVRPQLIITQYDISVEPLEPGTVFAIDLLVQNQGSANARGVTMIIGGGTGSSGAAGEGTPESGGLAGASGSFTEFAPVGASNVQSLGDLAQGATLTASQQLIVNATTKPGAYPLKVSFVYNDEQNGSFVDDQVITLLVLQRPLISFNFYAPPPPVFVGEMAPLPLQIVNTGTKTAVLGTFKVAAENATLENNSVFVGALEQGGFFPLDALLIANEPGMLELQLSVDYTDDFNQPQIITGALTVEVLEAMIPMEPELPVEGADFPVEEQQPESFGQKVWRFLLGFLGLSSAVPQPAGDTMPLDGMMPEEGMPSEFDAVPGSEPNLVVPGAG